MGARVRNGWIVLYCLLMAVAAGSAFTAGALGFSHDITHTKTVVKTKSYGTPDQTVDGAVVNPQLAGLKCSVYSKAKTIVCKP